MARSQAISHPWTNVRWPFIAILSGVAALWLVTALVSTPIAVRAAVDNVEEGTRRQVRADLLVLKCALDEYAVLHNGRYPQTLKELLAPDCLVRRQVLAGDPWGNAYQYAPPAPRNLVPYLASFGSDGRLGGAGKAADLTLDAELRRSSSAAER